MGPDPARELIERLEEAEIVITGEESMPVRNGEPMALRDIRERPWRWPPTLRRPALTARVE